MKITPDVFETFLKCPTKSWLRAAGEPATGNTYAEWVKAQTASYRATETQRLVAVSPPGEIAISPTAGDLKTAKWRLASSVSLQAQMESSALETELHAIERVPSEGRGRPAQFIPIRFIFRNKLTKDDKLLLAFDAFVLAESLGREIAVGKIIHGDRGCARESAANSGTGAEGQDAGPTSAALSRAQPLATKVKTSALAGEVRKRIEKLATLLADQSPPDLALNRHCVECEFQARCRKIAVEKDDLSLLARMSEKERKKLRSKGIFTVTQLSYTFRPRRRPKRMRDKREKYHHSLKALAIREKTIHIAGSPELKIDGTPVYLDVEGLPDRDFYYLIGVRIGNGESAVQHSLWADTVEDEGKIWREFLAILETVEKPVLIHYGSFETDFLERLRKRYLGPIAETSETRETMSMRSAVNILLVVFGQFYFPSYSNSLKEVAAGLGFTWSDPTLVGPNSVARRSAWERSRDAAAKNSLLEYNAQDCQAVEIVTQALLRLRAPHPWNNLGRTLANVVNVDSLKNPDRHFKQFASPFEELEWINRAAWWDYQRDRIYVNLKKAPKSNAPLSRRERVGLRNSLHVNKVIVCPDRVSCPVCGGKCKQGNPCNRMLYDLFFGSSSVKRWIVKYRFRYYRCFSCQRRFGEPHEFLPQSHFGRNLVAYVLYQTVDLCIPFLTVNKTLKRFFKLDVPVVTLTSLKVTANRYYKATYQTILQHLVTGTLLHIDETQVSIKGKTAYVWVFTNLHDVAYMYAESREGAFLQEMLKDFKGVLVSDFYGVYDSVNCEQQKCLVHLMRDINDEVLGHPYDEELKVIVRDFASLLKSIVETIDHRGLKRRFLGKHRAEVNRFYHKLAKLNCRSEQAAKCRQRFEKNLNKLFTFLSHDGIPWNNNNAEHAIRAFAKLRDVVRGCFTEMTVRHSLVLLSICQTCKYRGLDFFEFVRSGETDLYAFAESRCKRSRRSPASQPKAPLADETGDN